MAYKVTKTTAGVTVWAAGATEKQVLFGIASDRNGGELRRYGRDVPGQRRQGQNLWRWDFLADDLPALKRDLCRFYVEEAARFESTKAETKAATALLAKLCKVAG